MTRDATLAELLGAQLEVSFDSGLVRSCRRAWNRPLREMSPADVRVLLAQAWPDAVPYLVPIALEMLEADPWVDAAFFEGDLLVVVLSAKLDPFWRSAAPEQRQRAIRIAHEVRSDAELSGAADRFVAVHDP